MNASKEPQQQQSRMGVFMIGLGWLLILVLAAGYFADVERQQANPNPAVQAVLEGNQRTLTLKANRNEHFVVTGLINGREATFLLDTGATAVSVPASLQEYFGLRRGAASWAYTANGKVKVYDTRIDEIDLGGIILRDIEASLNPGQADRDFILLGMTALAQLDIGISAGQLTLRQALSL